MIYERVARPVLFRLGGGDAEAAHEWTLRRLARLAASPLALAATRRLLATPAAPREVFGLRFPNPVGLAAGMDKDGAALAAWPALGFGFVEVGTVTWHPQPGNERPRVFRLRSSGAVVNRMGFNNAGAAALASRLDALPPGRLGVPLGISLGKSKVTSLDEAVGDYLASLRTLYPYGDYFAVNVSSPNTPGLRTLQDRGYLSELLAALRTAALDAEVLRAEVLPGEALRGEALPGEALRAVAQRGPKPILVKIAPDLTEPAIADLLEVCLEHGVAGVIATNTTLRRTGLAPRDVMIGEQAGGLSGAPLATRARQVVAFVHRETVGMLPIIGVGGILAAEDAVALVDAGASLVQLYTGLIYRGPRLIRRTVQALNGDRGAVAPRSATGE